MSKRDLPCVVCGELMWRTASSEAHPKCRACRRANPKHGSSAYKSGCRCEVCLAYNRNRSRVRQERFKAENGVTESALRRRSGELKRAPRKRLPCGWCGEMHPLNDSGTTLNSEGLAHAQWVRNHGEPSKSRDIVLAGKRDEPRAAPRLKESSPVGGIFTSGPCAFCGEQCTIWSTNGRAAYCSKRCGRLANRRKRGRFAVSDNKRVRIYKRDDWKCQICGYEMSPEYSHDDPWSPTLDHIEPQSTMLVPDHSDANLRAAHAICNAIRNDGRLTDAQVRDEVRVRRHVAA